jgi:hypothetical protein
MEVLSRPGGADAHLLHLNDLGVTRKVARRPLCTATGGGEEDRGEEGSHGNAEAYEMEDSARSERFRVRSSGLSRKAIVSERSQ